MFVASRRWIDLAAAATHRTIRASAFRLNCCIEAACIAVGLAETFGFLCEPVPVAVRVLSASHKQVTMLPGPGAGRRTGGFAGHLLVSYPGAGVVVDLTSDQFHTRKRGLLVPAPLVMTFDRDRLAGGVEVTLPSGTKIAYREMVGDVSWRALPAWTESSAIPIAIARRHLDAALAPAS